MNDEDFDLFGVSPESALKHAPENRQLEIYPIQVHALVVLMLTATLIQLDARLEPELRLDHKEQAEHLMLLI